MLNALANHWWLMSLRGAATVVFGIVAWAWPGITLALLLIVFAGFALIQGLVALILGFSGKEERRIWWQMVVIGLLGVATGAITILWPKLTAVVLLLLIASWAILEGVLEIAAAVRLRQEMHGEWLLVLSGILAIIFGLLLFMRPDAGILAMVWLVGIFSVVSGILQVALSLKLRHTKHHPPGEMHHAMGT